MSDQRDTDGVITNLEAVFLSREFGHARPLGRPSMAGDVAHTDDSPPERRRTGAVIVPLLAPRAQLRQRAVAALSGVAAATIVLAGLVSQPNHAGGNGSPTISAEGPRGATSTPQGAGGVGGSSSSASPGGVSANVDANRTASGAASTNAADADAAGTASGQVVLTGEVHLGRAAEFTPSASGSPTSAVPVSGIAGNGAGGTAAATSPPPALPPPNQPLPASTGALSGVSGAVGSSVTNVGTTVVATLNQLASNVPATTPVGEALSTPGATVSGRGQSSGI